MKHIVRVLVLLSAVVLFPSLSSAQQSTPDTIERAVERFGVGVEGGVGLDPELIVFGAHGTVAPLFSRNVELRPGIEFGIGEVTTTFAVNADVIYILPGATGGTRWIPYIGAGPNIGLSHRGFGTDDGDGDNVDVVVNGVEVEQDEARNRFDFSDTDFNGGLNFIAGARNLGGFFMELKATAYGVSHIRLLAGFNF
jgi:hypothetical protein